MPNLLFVPALLSLLTFGSIIFTPEVASEVNFQGTTPLKSIEKAMVGGDSFLPVSINKINLGIFEVTAYSSSRNETDSTPFIMASNKRVYEGAIACPIKFSFGTVVLIENKVYVCEDRKNQLKHPDEFDIWMESKELALEFGVKKLEVFVVY